ncbi:MAG TPA: hypothetical protein VEH04_13190 [Verrucomicrobiae bacterium]|nr:hypothetical protein [Verrucomicrobiae bacterium]
MNKLPSLRAGHRSIARAAFTLVEIMIAVTLMSVIVLGLVAMFSQTQRAFRLGMNQTDVLEAGRVATDLIVRELEQMTPPLKTNSATPGFYTQLMHVDNTGWQALPGYSMRTNLMSDLFFVIRENQTWSGIGYFVRTNARIQGSFGPVGTLYRYQTNNSSFQFSFNPFSMWHGFNQARGNGVLTNVAKVLDGVVHFRVRAFDTNGMEIVSVPELNTLGTNYSSRLVAWSATNSLILPHIYDYRMSSNTLPAFVELEIGILENQSYERYQAAPTHALKLQSYRTNFVGNVHLFRQRVSIRRVDLPAYQ